jgi:hypothetical protein
MLPATSANYASGSLAMVLPDFTPSVSTPLAPPPSTSFPVGAYVQPQANEHSRFVTPLPPSSSSSFAFGGLGGVFVAPAPSFVGAFDAKFNFAAPSSSAPRRRGDRRGNIIYKKVDDLRIEDDREDDDSLDEKYYDAGLVTYDLVMGVDLSTVSTCGLEKIIGCISGSTLSSFETNLRQKENGLRCFANLLRWQCGSPRPQPPGGTPVLGQLITVLARVDGLVVDFVADNGGQQQQFVGATSSSGCERGATSRNMAGRLTR